MRNGRTKCSNCNGTGRINGQECGRCEGEGYYCDHDWEDKGTRRLTSKETAGHGGPTYVTTYKCRHCRGIQHDTHCN